VPTPHLERAVRAARRRQAGQRLLDRLTVGCVAALAVGLAWVLLDTLRWWVPLALLLLAVIVAVVRTVHDYPGRLAAALELDSRFDLKERVTAAIELPPDQLESPVGRVLAAAAETHTTGLRLGEQFPLRLRRSAALVPVLAGLIAVALVWPPATDSGLFADTKRKPDDATNRPGSDPQPHPNPVRQPNPDAPKGTDAERLAALRADLDRLEREARDGRAKDDRRRVAELTAAEDAARTLERESLDRLARMENQLKQLDRLANSPEFKDGPGRDAAAALASGDLGKAEMALDELAKAATEKPADLQLRKQLDRLKDELRKAADNTEAREKLEKLIEQAKKENRDTEGLRKELDRLDAESESSKPLRDLAGKLDAASQQLEKGDAAEAAKQLAAAAGAVRDLRDQTKAAQDAQAQVQRVERLKADAAKPNGDPIGSGGVADKPPPMGNPPAGTAREVRPRVPFVDPKGAMTPAGAGEFGDGFTKTDPAKLGTAIGRAARSAPAATAGQPLAPDDRDAVREFFERLGGADASPKRR
jgi:hypothetical protein